MEVTYVVIIAVVTLIAGAINKAFIPAMDDKYIPLQNLVIGVISAIICIVSGVEADILQAVALCITASMGAGGVYDAVKGLISNK